MSILHHRLRAASLAELQTSGTMIAGDLYDNGDIVGYSEDGAYGGTYGSMDPLPTVCKALVKYYTSALYVYCPAGYDYFTEITINTVPYAIGYIGESGGYDRYAYSSTPPALVKDGSYSWSIV